MSVWIDENTARVSPPAEPGQQYCDACTKYNAKYRLCAKAGEHGTTRTMRLCDVCFADMYRAFDA
jgi:hypothetical protein